MRGKKWTICLGALLLAAAAVLAVLAVGAWNRVTPEKVQRAATARKLLMESADRFALAQSTPEYLVGRYIDEDCRLQIRLCESAREQEAVIREVLGEYGDLAVFSYVPYTFSELRGMVSWDIERILRQQGFSVTDVWAVLRTGDIHIELEDNGEITAVAAWIKEQKGYPFEGLGVDIVFKPNAEKYLLSEPGAEALKAYLKEQGGYKAYKDYYCGYYIGLDGLLHVVLKEGITKAEKAGLQSCLKPYSDAVVYEYGGYPEEETQQYLDDLAYALIQLGLGVTGWGLDGYNGQPTIAMVREDIPIAQALMRRENTYPLGSDKFTVIFEYGEGIYLSPDADIIK